MTPTTDWLKQAEKHIRKVLLELRPQLLAAQGHIEHELKGDKTIVTKMDVLVERRLKDALHEFAPEVGFAGEETGADLTQQTFWLVDPIDGTESFTRGLPFATNMIALIHDGRPRLGVVYNFATDEFFSAVEGQGAFCNGHPIHVSDRPLHRSMISIGTMKGHPKGGELTNVLIEKIYCNVKVAASGWELSAVARGAIEGRICVFSGVKPWDVAPGALLVKEAGGRVANLGSDGYIAQDSQLIAANAVIFDEVRGIIDDFLDRHPRK